jgi:hypothetical protein
MFVCSTQDGGHVYSARLADHLYLWDLNKHEDCVPHMRVPGGHGHKASGKQRLVSQLVALKLLKETNWGTLYQFLMVQMAGGDHS